MWNCNESPLAVCLSWEEGGTYQRYAYANREAGRQLELDEAFETGELLISDRHQVDDGDDLFS